MLAERLANCKLQHLNRLHTAKYPTDSDAEDLPIQPTLPLAAQIFDYLPKPPRSTEVHFVTDCYRPRSIKSFERTRRGQAPAVCIGGPKTELKTDFKTFLCNDDNKTQLIKFLLTQWKSDKYARRLFGRKVLFVAEFECYCLQSFDGISTTATVVESLCSSQEEADTRIILHCQHIDNTIESTDIPIVVHSPDTDVLVLLVSYAATVSTHLIFETGTGNNRRLVDVTGIAEALDSSLGTALPALHAFTGCDYTSSFVRRGKVKPFQIMAMNEDFTETFGQLGLSDTVDEDTQKVIEQFVCAIYGKPLYRDVNKLRYDLFKARYQPKSAKKTFMIDEGIDMSLLPPCRSSLKMHIMRTNYVTTIWKQAHVAEPKLQSPDGSGWKIDQTGNITVEWNSSSIMPQDLIDVIIADSTAPADSRTATSSSDIDVLDCTDCVEEDYEVDNIIDFISDTEEDD